MGFDISVLKKLCPSSENKGELTAYSTDSSSIKGEALAVAWPATPEQLKMLIKFAAREEISLVPRGGGTSLVGGAVPQKSIVVDMSRMNKIRKLHLSGKTVIVQAGVILDKLNLATAEYGLELPVIPNSHSSCTIGGMIATNAGGAWPSPKRWMKEWVRDITFLDGTGKVYTLDKNEARRFMGTEGTCGIIIEATLNLLEKSETSTDLFKFGGLTSLMEKVKELKEDHSVIAMGYVNSLASQIAGMGQQEILLVKYSDKKRGVIEPSEAKELWHKYENLYSILSTAGFPRVEDTLFASDVEKFVDWVNKQEIPCYGKIGSGNMHPHLKDLGDVERIAAVVSELKGSMVGEFGIGMLRRKYAPFGTTHNVRELRARYDPKGILNKGKVL